MGDLKSPIVPLQSARLPSSALVNSLLALFIYETSSVMVCGSELAHVYPAQILHTDLIVSPGCVP